MYDIANIAPLFNPLSPTFLDGQMFKEPRRDFISMARNNETICLACYIQKRAAHL